MGPFVLDFYAPRARLAIELDGTVHDETYQRAYDKFRQELIEQYDVEFVRFSNEAIETSTEAVVAQVVETVKSRTVYFDHKVKWVPAGEIEPGCAVLSNGQRNVRTVNSIQRFDTSETVYELRVSEDNPYVTELCTIQADKRD